MSEKMSPAERISFVLYEVFVPRVYLQSADAANFYGTPTQDNPMAQREQEIGDIRCSLPATRLAELYSRGCMPWFIQVNKTAELYKAMYDYLREAKDNFDRSPTSTRFNEDFMEFLLKLENFAQWVFGVATPYLPMDIEDLSNTLAGWSRRSPIGRRSRAELEQEQVQEQESKHERVVDEMMERHIARTRLGWR